MTVLRIILGDQLSLDLSALDDLDARRDIVLMMGVLEENTHVRHHKQKIVLVLSAMRHFADNQLTRTAAVELARRAPDALCIALHPGTVATPLAAPFAATGLEVHTPEQAAAHLLKVVDRLTANANGGFFDWRGQPVPW